MCGALLDDPRVPYTHNGKDTRIPREENARVPREENSRVPREDNRDPRCSSSNRKSNKQAQTRLPRAPRPTNPFDFPGSSSCKREYLVSTGDSRHFLPPPGDPVPAIDEVGWFLEQAEARSRSVKQLAREVENQKYLRAIEQRQEKQMQRQKELKQQHVHIEPQQPKGQDEVLHPQNSSIAHPSAMDTTVHPVQAHPQSNGTTARSADVEADPYLQQSGPAAEPPCNPTAELDPTGSKKLPPKSDPVKSQSHQVLKVTLLYSYSFDLFLFEQKLLFQVFNSGAQIG